MRFEWDDNKAESNFVKHGITFREAVTIFADPSFSQKTLEIPSKKQENGQWGKQKMPQ